METEGGGHGWDPLHPLLWDQEIPCTPRHPSALASLLVRVHLVFPWELLWLNTSPIKFAAN